MAKEHEKEKECKHCGSKKHGSHEHEHKGKAKKEALERMKK